MPMTLTRRQTPAATRVAVPGGRSREAVLATDQPVEVFDARANRVILEALLLEGAEWSEPVPLLVDHDRRIPSQIGSVVNIRRESGKLAGTLHFARNDAADQAWSLVSDNHARALSIGYRVVESVELHGGQTKTIGGKLFSAPAGKPLRIVTRWVLREISVVVIPADEAATIRSDSLSLCERTSSMPASTLSAIPGRSIDQMKLSDLGALVLRSRDQAVPDNPSDLLEAAFPTRGRAGTSGVGGVDELLNIITTWCLDGWRQGVDTLAGVYRIASASSYLEEKLATVSVHPKMTRIGRGEVAPSANFEVDSASSRIMKFGLQFCLAEEDVIDGEPLGIWRIAIEETARAARALVGDLLWATLIKNPVCADGLKIFDDARGNKSAASLDKTELDAAMLAVAGHTGVDDCGNPVHYNLRPNYLIVCPSKLHEARRLVRPTICDGGELRVLAESRMGQAGVLDPVADEVLVAGNGRNWMLAAGGEQKPSIVLSLLNGQTEPRVRQFALDRGRWGLGFDVSFSCAATALSGAPLYWSSADG